MEAGDDRSSETVVVGGGKGSISSTSKVRRSRLTGNRVGRKKGNEGGRKFAGNRGRRMKLNRGRRTGELERIEKNDNCNNLPGILK